MRFTAIAVLAVSAANVNAAPVVPNLSDWASVKSWSFVAPSGQPVGYFWPWRGPWATGKPPAHLASATTDNAAAPAETAANTQVETTAAAQTTAEPTPAATTEAPATQDTATPVATDVVPAVNLAAGAVPVYTDESGKKTPVPPASDLMISVDPTGADVAGSSPLGKALLKYSNDVRAQFGAGNLKWSQTLAEKSKAWAEKCSFTHAGMDNLSKMMSSSATYVATDLIKMWAEEWKDFPFDHPAKSAYSHFTMMVWKESSEIGCSWHMCGTDVLFSCVYDTGNFGGDDQYAANVGKWVHA